MSSTPLALVDDSDTAPAPGYQPLSSIWEGGDGELLNEMLRFYPVIEPAPILDATYNTGRIWAGTDWPVTSMDIDYRYHPDIVADNRKMPGVADESYAVVVYDPPHVGPQGRDKSSKRFDVDFGATVECGKEHGWTLSYLYPPFLEQAMRVLKPEGLLLAKITDMVNSHRNQWAHVDFMTMAAAAGFTVCDMIIKIRTGPMVSTKWKRARHARKRHCFWIICRKSHRCEPRITWAETARSSG
ncbi:MAG: hypothetical protein OXN79_04155 [bacterium]|nr:hypothetical protein [Dehalococcoidia bacterium]MDE0215757.1 hypothetical protein [bacterium]